MPASSTFCQLYSLPLWEVREPKPGFRHGTKTLIVSHRFPVKGGISTGKALTFSRKTSIMRIGSVQKGS
jgi:hypothetical protein